MNESILEMTGVTKRYGNKTVLQDLNLTVPKGTVMGLLGKNAAGKTTLLNCAVGLAKPQKGDVTILGEPAWNLSAQGKERLGYVPQIVKLYPWMKVSQIIQYTAGFYPKWNRELISRLVQEWELNPSEKVKILSEGQLQKLGILLAIGHEPEFLVLDEPAASLDPSARRQFLKTILDLASESECTVLFSTHITSDLERVADTVAILREGRIVYCGGLEELKESVKQLNIISINSLPLNLSIPGMLNCRKEGNEALVTIQGVNEALIQQLTQQFVAQIKVKDLNLEDIFMEFHHE